MAAHKGGSGKTTVAVNLAAALTVSNRVLLIDGDPQGAAAAALAAEAEKPTLYEVLSGTARLEDAIRPTHVRRLDVLPADLDLAGAEIELPRRAGWQLALRETLRGYREHDFVIIDTAPGLGVLPYVGLAAAKEVLIVCPPEFLAYRALNPVFETVRRARELTGDTRVLGVVPTMASRITRHSNEVLDALAADYPELLLPEIPRRIAVQDAQIAGQPMIEFSPYSDATRAFGALAEEVMKRA